MTIIESERTETGRHVTVLVDRCAGCQECVIRCPAGALSMEPASWTAQANDAACVGCRQCERTCPFSAIVVEGPLALATRVDPPLRHPVELHANVTETRQGYASWDEAIAEANRCLACPDPTCVRGCPAHNDIPAFVAAVRAHDLEGAHAILRRTTVLPDVCSRVCNQAAQCEGSCTWSLAGGEPVAIGRLERFIADQAAVPAPVVAEPAATALSVGIVGSGPAAIGAAYELLAGGARVTVYERDDRPGGLLVWGIPDFTLPDDVARRPWDDLVAAGVDLRLATSVEPGDIDQLLEAHDALVMAHGAGQAMRLSVPGADLDGVGTATAFLQGAKAALDPGGDPEAFRASLGIAPERGRRVLVLGAGNTAMDVARLARRLGLEATCVDWLDERFALARPDELAEARSEGVDVRFSRTLTSLEGFDGRVVRAVLSHTTQRDRASTPVVSPDSLDVLPVDLVVMAMGYRIDEGLRARVPQTPIAKRHRGFAPGRWRASGILANPASPACFAQPVGALALDREVGLWEAAMPRRERLWAAGDALTGPSTVVEAMAQGRRAARSVLDARPTRGGRARDPEAPAPRVLVAYASASGTTARLAEVVGDELRRSGATVSVLPVERVDALAVAQADALVLGTWVEGLVVARVRAASAMREFVDGLPWLGGRPVALFCTYGVNPRSAPAELAHQVEARGGSVVASAAFSKADRAEDARIRPTKPEAFARRVAAEVLAPRARPAVV